MFWIVSTVLTAGLGTFVESAPISHNTVIVELFTSEGCSDCPPAEDILSWLSEKQPVSDARITALALHVDYWNSARWRDSYSSHAFTDRQSAYSDRFKLDSIYTPQMVIDGRVQCVGGDRQAAIQAIEAVSKSAKAEVTIETGSGFEHTLPVTVTVGNVPRPFRGQVASVWIAVTEDHLASSVRGGENSGRHFIHNDVVRELFRAADITPGSGSWKWTGNVRTKSSQDRRKLHVVAFVQENGDLRIIGATST